MANLGLHSGVCVDLNRTANLWKSGARAYVRSICSSEYWNHSRDERDINVPYIKQECRKALLDGEDPCQPGALNFLITREIKDYLDTHGLSYQTINDIIGALSCCQQEFYRRVAVPYEEEKIKINGDVY